MFKPFVKTTFYRLNVTIRNFEQLQISYIGKAVRLPSTSFHADSRTALYFAFLEWESISQATC